MSGGTPKVPDPTPTQIRKRAAKIRRGWSKSIRRQRLNASYQSRPIVAVEVSDDVLHQPHIAKEFDRED